MTGRSQDGEEISTWMRGGVWDACCDDGLGLCWACVGACFADFGHRVTCVDTDPAKIEALRRGQMPIYEPGLADLVADNVRQGRLAFTTDLAAPVREADAVFIAVGTP